MDPTMYIKLTNQTKPVLLLDDSGLNKAQIFQFVKTVVMEWIINCLSILKIYVFSFFF